MLEIVTFKWKPQRHYRSKFGPETVNVLRSMLERHYEKPHRLTCITDDSCGIDSRVRIIPLWDDHSKLRNPSGAHNPSCYRRLKLFSREAAELIGPRFVVLDLDVVILSDISPIFDRTEDFLIWGDTHPRTWYNGSLWMLTAGSRTKVWEEFDPVNSPRLAHSAGRFGSDQGWISYCLGPNETKLGKEDGVYSYRVHLKEGTRVPPDNARIVIFHGKHDPWHPMAQQHQWVRAHYR